MRVEIILLVLHNAQKNITNAPLQAIFQSIPAKTKLNRICSVYTINNPMTDYASVTAGVYMSFLIPIVESPFVHLI